VVIGGTSGLGRAIAIGMAEAGADVIATGRRLDLVESVAGEIEARGRRTMRRAADVVSRPSLDEFRAEVMHHFGGADVLVYAAGRIAKLPTQEMSEADWSAIQDTNLTGALRSAQAFYEMLKASGRGRIIHICSLNSYVSLNQVAAYAASKAALLALTRSLAVEWARDGINVNAIAPGVFLTDLNRNFLESSDRGKELLMRTPMGRFGKSEELVGAAVLLASDAASFITGQCIAVDGGFLASGVNAVS